MDRHYVGLHGAHSLFYLTSSMAAELFELRGITRSRREAVKRSLLPKGGDANARAGFWRAAWDYGELSFEDALNLRRLANTPATLGARSRILDL